MTDEVDLLTETDVEGTWMDPEYLWRFWEAQRVGLWVWAEEWQPYYWDQFVHEKSRPHC
jgi:hypothetical protein